MRYGICIGLERAKEALDAGFDYVELSATAIAACATWPEKAYAGLNVYATNLFFPGEMKIVGPNPDDWRPYARSLFERTASLGVRVMVLGSGGPRRSPEGFSIKEAHDQFVAVAAELDETARSFGMRVAPESLNRTETNVGNDLPSLAFDLELRGAPFCADAYHCLTERRLEGASGPPNSLFWREQIPNIPMHVHVGDVLRHLPTSDDAYLTGFFGRLRELGYSGGVSLECDLGDTPLATGRKQIERLASGAY